MVIIFPLIVMVTSEFLALELTVIVLEKAPNLFVSYLTLIIPVLPGGIGALGHSGTVQPQVAFTLFRIKGPFPLLVNLNSQFPSLPCTIVQIGRAHV